MKDIDRLLNEHTILNNSDTVPYITFKSLENIPWLKCGFSTRLGGVSKGIFSSMNMSFTRGDVEADVRKNIGLFSKSAGFNGENIVMPHQCHTTNVRIVGKDDRGCGVTKPGCKDEIDGQITKDKDTVLYCMGADCVPVFIADIKEKVVAASHAGWKGTVENIVKATVEKMVSELGCDPRNMKAVIGPSICKDCYEVSKDVAERFIEVYNTSLDVVKPASGDFNNNPSEKYFLNLWEANRINLMGAGLSPESIEISGYCTRSHPDMLFSHRFHGEKRGVNIGYIFIKEQT
ncbi:MAG: peptidoglycan editing factor PgeF [Lachnospiraceae bacterium]|nr:peptidoglycan editing factor PgeF [Lachnospiraceae bacterium]